MDQSNADGTPLYELILNGVMPDGNPVTPGTKGDKSRAANIEVVVTGDKGTDLPSNLAVNLNDDEDVTVSLVLAESNEVIRSDGDVSAVNERGPDVNVLVTLIGGRDGGSVSDLLAPVSDVSVETVVVDSDLVVWVARGECDLEVGG